MAVSCPDTPARLPQEYDDPAIRQQDLEVARAKYALRHDPNTGQLTFPVRVNSLSEDFSLSYELFLASRLVKEKAAEDLEYLKSFLYTITKFADLRRLYVHTQEHELGSEPLETFYVPHSIRYFQTEQWFGQQRLTGVDPTIIRLCTKLPEALSDCQADLEDKDRNLLEGMTVQEAIEQKRLFVCDLRCLVPYKHGMEGRVVPSPVALFFHSGEDDLLPVAIRMFPHQETAAKTDPQPNPVFLRPAPGDAERHYTWTLVKMWYNCAEACYHETTSHLMLTHLVSEGFCLATHRHLHVSHPIFRLLAPHFVGTLAINWEADSTLLKPGGDIDRIVNIGAENGLELGKSVLSNWRMDVEGTLPQALLERGLDDENVLKDKYLYRDDAMALYLAIQNYAKQYIETYYSDDALLCGDWEIQEWAHTLANDYKIKGVPNGGELVARDELVMMVTCIIFTASVQHAAVNFAQYDQYGFPPNYPGYLKGSPPSNAQEKLTEEEVLKCLGKSDILLHTMQVTQLLSSREEKDSLGTGLEDYMDKEVDAKVKGFIARFREELEEIREKIELRNMAVINGARPQQVYYDYLNPARIPNSIKI